MDKRIRWFREGAHSYRKVMIQRGDIDHLDVTRDMYPCPLCLGLFPIEAIADGRLTIEHVPPESLGGRGLLLTCASCNNTAGSAFDAEAGKAEQLRNFFEGKHDGSIKAKLGLNGDAVNGQMHISDTGQSSATADPEISIEAESGFSITFNTVPRVNNPAHIDQFDQAWNIPPDGAFTLSIEPNIRTSLSRASISWIRTAYLAAFSTFGWRYVLRPIFDPVRAQLRLGRDAQLPELYWHDATAEPQCREIIVAHQDTDFPCVVVVIGKHIVFLPFIGPNVSLEALAQAVSTAQADGRPFSGVSEPWPNYPRYLLDRLADHAL